MIRTIKAAFFFTDYAMLYKPCTVTWLFICVILAGCANGARRPTDAVPDTYPVQIQARTLKFDTVPEQQTRNGIQVDPSIRDSLPQLYYRYEVTSHVNGNYFMMPDPPRVYRVYRIPFYRDVPPNLVLKLTLSNTTDRVMDTSHAVCAFDLNGQTILSRPLNIPDLLPGHTLTTRIKGPSLDQLAGHSTLVVWIYQLSEQHDTTPYEWTLPYDLISQSRSAFAQFIGQSPQKSDVAQYEGRIEAENAAPPPTGGAP